MKKGVHVVGEVLEGEKKERGFLQGSSASLVGKGRNFSETEKNWSEEKRPPSYPLGEDIE